MTKKLVLYFGDTEEDIANVCAKITKILAPVGVIFFSNTYYSRVAWLDISDNTLMKSTAIEDEVKYGNLWNEITDEHYEIIDVRWLRDYEL